jgi:hypothetical protein
MIPESPSRARTAGGSADDIRGTYDRKVDLGSDSKKQDLGSDAQKKRILQRSRPFRTFGKGVFR